jgi:hypothetical protein
MFKIIKLDGFSYPDSLELSINDPMFQSENFERTLAGNGLTDVLDLKKRSSWTHKSNFHLRIFPNEVSQFMEENNILTYKDDLRFSHFSLIKYEAGDFFLNHRDTDLSNVIDKNHKYTCLIFCPYGEDYKTLEGGELILTHPDGLYEIKFDPAVETRQGRFVMVIFSIDMYHEVLPIIKGTRYVFKKPLFVKTTLTKTFEKFEINEDDGNLCDGFGGYDVFGHSNTVEEKG